MKTGIERIHEERTRQITTEGWSSSHDDEHPEMTLWRAGTCYETAGDMNANYGTDHRLVKPEIWPWEDEWWKPATNAIRNYEKAGALFKAEADRFRRMDRFSDASHMDTEANRVAGKIDSLLNSD